MFLSSKLLLFACLLVHCCLLDNKLEPRTLFVSMSLLSNVQFTMTQLLPRLFGLMADARVSLSRIESFLALPELKLDARDRDPGAKGAAARGKATRARRALSARSLSVAAPGATSEGAGRLLLRGLSFELSSSQRSDETDGNPSAADLLLVCGQSGAGKSSLLLTLLNELPLASGSLEWRGPAPRLSYCSQEAWLFQGTIRENILVGRELDWSRYRRVLEACSLERDLEQLGGAGDLTRVQAGSLSGGQRARVNLARCLYAEADLYLLDDPLAALDERVARQAIERALGFVCSQGARASSGCRPLLARKLVVLVSHKLELMLDCMSSSSRRTEPRFLLLEAGRQLGFGRARELLAQLESSGATRLDTPLAGRSFPGRVLELLTMTRDRKEREEQMERKLEASKLGLGFSAHEESEEHEHEAHMPAAPYRTTSGACESGRECETEREWTRSEAGGQTIKHRATAMAQDGASARIKGKTNNNKTSTTMVDGNENDSERDLSGCSAKFATRQKQEPSSNGEPSIGIAARLGHPLAGQQTRSKDIGRGTELPAPSDCCTIKDEDASDVGERPSSSDHDVDSDSDSDSHSDSHSHSHSDCDCESDFDLEFAFASEADSKQTGNLRSGNSSHKAAINNRGPPDRMIIAGKQQRNSNDKREKSTPNPITNTNTNVNVNPRNDKGSKFAKMCFIYYTRDRQSPFAFVLIVVTFLMTQCLFSTLDVYLSVWSLAGGSNNLIANTNTNKQPHQTSALVSLNLQQQSDNTRNASTRVEEIISLINNNATQQNTREIGTATPTDAIGAPIRPLLPRLRATKEQKVTLANWNKNLDYELDQREQVDLYAGQSPISSADQSAEIEHTLAELECLPDDEDELAHVKPLYRPLLRLTAHFGAREHALAYASLLGALLLVSGFTQFNSLRTSAKSANYLYKRLTDSALFAKLSFFDQTPHARFLNRAARDMSIIDEAIPYAANQAYETLLQTAATLLLVSLLDCRLALPSLIMLILLVSARRFHLVAARDLQRLEGALKAPLLNHVAATLEGLVTLRSHRRQSRVLRYWNCRYERHQDAHTSALLLCHASNRLLGVALDCLNACYVSISVLLVIFTLTTTSLDDEAASSWSIGLSSSAGLVITSAMLLSGLTQHGLMKLTETETLMTSVERVIEYASLPQEEEEDARGDRLARVGVAPSSPDSGRAWPRSGRLEFKQVDLYYERGSKSTAQLQQPPSADGAESGCSALRNDQHRMGSHSPFDQKPVLKNVSFLIESGQKIGLIGRTGAGKSSIISTLFRLYDFHGSILLDGRDIKRVKLHHLRSSLAIIPQQAILFRGTIRFNLDPWNEHSDSSLWSALEKANLRDVVGNLPGKLDSPISGGGGSGSAKSNDSTKANVASDSSYQFSCGQKQLLCLARVLLKQQKCKLLVLDEATANVDPATDELIQRVIRREFKETTVLTIAHRLETILDSDKIMILEAGKLTHFDSPARLRAQGNNYFADSFVTTREQDTKNGAAS